MLQFYPLLSSFVPYFPSLLSNIVMKTTPFFFIDHDAFSSLLSSFRPQFPSLLSNVIANKVLLPVFIFIFFLSRYSLIPFQLLALILFLTHQHHRHQSRSPSHIFDHTAIIAPLLSSITAQIPWHTQHLPRVIRSSSLSQPRNRSFLYFLPFSHSIISSFLVTKDHHFPMTMILDTITPT